MKVLVMTHISDIDGMGCAVLGKIAYEDCDVEFVNYNDINQKLNDKLDDLSIYNYDRVYVTDICPNEEVLTKIWRRSSFSSIIRVFDHHAMAEQNGAGKYSFVDLKIKDEKGMCSGTSLFYEYLKKGAIWPTRILEDFVELTRRQDTWEWKTIYNDKKADDLAQLFNAIGKDSYVKRMKEKIEKNNAESTFEFDEDEKDIIANYRKQIQDAIDECVNHMYFRVVKGKIVGIGNIDYKYRNEVAQWLRDNDYPIDALALPNYTNNACSFRTIKEGVDVNKLAMGFGGGGHKEASSCPITPELKVALNLLGESESQVKPNKSFFLTRKDLSVNVSKNSGATASKEAPNDEEDEKK